MLRSLCIALAASALPAALSAATPLPEMVVPNTCGVQLKANNNDNANLDLIRDAGFRVVRRGFIWASVEKQEGVYDFTEYDRLMKECEDRGLFVLGCIALNNEKLYGHVKEERGRNAYAKYAAALADRYKGRKVVWELWNEPNVATFWGKHGKHNTEPYAEEYYQLVKATVPLMKKADPNCFIMAGSVSNLWSASYEWQKFMFDKGVLKTGIDAWSIHPYGLKSPEDHADGYAIVRKMITDSGNPLLPFINSERGFSLGKGEGYAGGDDRLALEYQAWHAVRQYLIDLLSDVKLTIWYEWGGMKEGFALINDQKQDQPALVAMKVMMWQLDGFRLDQRLPLANNRDFALRFVKPNGAVKVVAWTAPPAMMTPDMTTPHEVSLPVEASGALGLVSLYGDESSIEAKDGALKIKLQAAPQYITIKPDPAAKPKPAITKPSAVSLEAKPAAAAPAGPSADLRMFEAGAEWKVAKVGGEGSFTLASEGGKPVGAFDFDFSGGGQYILATGKTNIEQGPTAITFSARTTIPQRVTVRINDSTGQVHQFKGAVKGSGEWETVTVPLTKKLEHWDGANDGVIHYPIKSISLSLPAPAGDVKAGKILFADLTAVTGPAPAGKPAAAKQPAAKPAKTPAAGAAAPTAAPVADASGRMDLKLFEKGVNWKLGKSGGAGQFSLAADGDTPIGIFNYDFTAGGSYVVVTASTNVPEGAKAITFSARGPVAQRITVRMYDQTKQCLQFKGAIKGTGAWETITIPLDKKMEHWDGANDGAVHFPITSISLSLPAPTTDTKSGKIEFSSLAATNK